MKIQKIEGNGVYEQFQQYAWDYYLGGAMNENTVPAYQTAPVPGSTLRESVRTRMKKFGIVVKGTNLERFPINSICGDR